MIPINHAGDVIDSPLLIENNPQETELSVESVVSEDPSEIVSIPILREKGADKRLRNFFFFSLV